jgi:hypothetical protein
MDELLSGRPGGEMGLPEPTESLDPFLQRRLEERPWELRAAQWRAWALAQEVFGKGVQVRLAGGGGSQGFRGLLTLDVPFTTLGDHRTRERIFLSWAGADPILTQVPLVYVFQPFLQPLPVP